MRGHEGRCNKNKSKHGGSNKGVRVQRRSTRLDTLCVYRAARHRHQYRAAPHPRRACHALGRVCPCQHTQVKGNKSKPDGDMEATLCGEYGAQTFAHCAIPLKLSRACRPWGARSSPPYAGTQAGLQRQPRCVLGARTTPCRASSLLCAHTAARSLALASFRCSFSVCPGLLPALTPAQRAHSAVVKSVANLSRASWPICQERRG